MHQLQVHPTRDEVYRTTNVNYGAELRAKKRKQNGKKKSIVQNERTARDLSGSFAEHTWEIERTAINYPDSNIDVKCPQLSRGLTSMKATNRLAKAGPNCLPEPVEISSLELFIRQFWNLFWILLTGAATLSLMQFVLDPGAIVCLYITGILYATIVVMCTVSW